MTDPDVDRLRRIAFDSTVPIDFRVAAVLEAAKSATPAATELLLEVGGRAGEPEALLRAAGTALAWLQSSGTEISEWDVRDLTPPAAEAFLE